jgi:probable rRNA maturation factor
MSVAILSDPEIRDVNRQYLQHDYETDVISFDLSDDDSFLDGELVISADTARRMAEEVGWGPEAELLLYAIHGMLHVLGYEDDTAEGRDDMRRMESYYLKEFQIQGWERHPTHGEAKPNPMDGEKG